LRLQSAISTFTRSISVAEGVFAPGHLGELTRYLPFELVDAVLAETGRVERRVRDLPSRVGVYFVLAVRNEVLRVRAGVRGPCRWAVAAA
jgi:hypothetical protein